MAENNFSRDITNTLYKGAPAPLVGTLGVLSLTSYYLYQYTAIAKNEIATFVILVLSLVFIRAAIVFRYMKLSKFQAVRSFKTWEIAYMVPTCLTGVVFGSAVFHFHDPVSAASNLMLYIAVLGLASGASVSYYSSLPTLFSFLFTCTLPTIFSMLFRSQDPRDPLVGIMSLLWLMICIRSAKVVHQGFLRKEELKTKQLELHRLRGLNKLAGGVAHEINNPLAIISGISQLMTDDDDHKSRERAFEKIDRNIERIKGVTQSLLTFSEPSMLSKVGEHRPVAEFMQQIFDITRGIATKHGVEFSLDIEESLKHVEFPTPPQLAEAIANIIINGIEAAEANEAAGKKFTKLKVSHDSKSIELRVEDSGAGFGDGDTEDIFLPFYSTKDVGEGKGLGLTMANSTIKNLGGELKLDKSAGHTTFLIAFPLSMVSKVVEPVGQAS